MSGSDSPTFFHGQPWSSWIERIGRDKPLSKFRIGIIRNINKLYISGVLLSLLLDTTRRCT